MSSTGRKTNHAEVMPYFKSRRSAMSKKMLINATTPDEIRVAIVENGLLHEVGIETSQQGQISGNIYKGVVTRLEPSLNAAFVDYGGSKNGFLPADEIHPKYYKTSPKRENEGIPPIQKILARNQQLLVQVSQDPRGDKGALLTTYLSIPGRYLVLMPYRSKNGVSRKIADEKERERLKRLIDEINPSDEHGFIVRTAGEGRKKNELVKEAKSLRRLWHNISSKAAKAGAPSLIYQESNLAIRTIRDYLTPDISEILVDNPDLFIQIQDFIKATMPRARKLLKLYREKTPLFDKYRIEQQIESIYNHEVTLPSGGNIVIEPTEALVSIDVNTAKTTVREDYEHTAFKTNLEAAHEIARQLRLRDLGGLIVIDFIDMENRKHRSEVEKALREAFKGDKARVRFSRISSFGLLEMSRQRLRPSLESTGFDICPYCGGGGRVKSSKLQAHQVYRKIQAVAAKKRLLRVEGTLPAETARYLLNEMREHLLALERECEMRINITVHASPLEKGAMLRFVSPSKDSTGEIVEEVHL